MFPETDKTVHCDCLSDEHQIRFMYNKSDELPELYITVHLSDCNPWYKRLWVGIKYILGYKSKYGHWDNLVLTEVKARQIKDLIDDYLK